MSVLRRAGPRSRRAPICTRHRLSALLSNRQAQDYWVRRLLAYVIDGIIVYAIVGLLAAAADLPTYFEGLFVPNSSVRVAYGGGFFVGIAGLIFVLYFTIAEAQYGETVGKHIWGLRVTTDSGQKPSLGTSLLRNISKIYWVLLLLDVIVGLALEVGYTKKFSDRFLGTKVS